MMIDKEIDRILTLLRNKIREQGFTQLQVQEKLGWGRSYISQLLTKQKSLRVEQVLMILSVINVDPAKFYAELYHFPESEVGMRRFGEYPELLGRGAGPSWIGEPTAGKEGLDFFRSFSEVRSLLRGLVRLLVDKNLINIDELTAAVKASDAGPMLSGPWGGEEESTSN